MVGDVLNYGGLALVRRKKIYEAAFEYGIGGATRDHPTLCGCGL